MIRGAQGILSDLARCVRTCEECERVCNEALRQGLERGGVHADPEHVRLLLDCSRAVARGAEILRRGWWEHTPACLECASLCEACALECGGFDDPTLRDCAEVCRRCAECCRRAAAAHAGLAADGDEAA